MTRKPDLIAAFGDWLTICSCPLERALAHLRDTKKAGLPPDDVAVVQTSEMSGKLAVTVLADNVQPFIRYDLGDCERYDKEPCPCGSPFRRFAAAGREATFVRVGEVQTGGCHGAKKTRPLPHSRRAASFAKWSLCQGS